MSFNFPNAPTIGQLHPDPATVGLPQYQWNGSEWVTPAYNPLDYVRKSGDSMTGALLLHANATAALQAVPKQQLETYAAPFDAMAYSGMQVNGSMEVNQERGLNNPVSATAQYGADQWQLAYNGTAAVNLGTYASSVISAFPGFGCYLGMNVSVAQASMGANDYYLAMHHVEGFRIARLAWGTANAKPITISFWCRHANAGTHALAIRNGPNTHSYVATYTQNVAQVDEYKTIVIPGPTIGVWETTNLRGMEIIFTAACGSAFTAPAANTWYAANYFGAPGQVNAVAGTSARLRITGFTVIPGTQGPTAAQSPLIMRSYDDEIITCQRYFAYLSTLVQQQGYTSPGIFYETFQYPTLMRAVPTISALNVTYTNCSGISIYVSTLSHTTIQLYATVAGEAHSSFDLKLDARL